MEVAQSSDSTSILFKVLVKQGHLGQVPVCLCKVWQKHKKANTKQWQHQTMWDGCMFIKHKNPFCCQVLAFLVSIVPVMYTVRSKAGLSAAKQSMTPTRAMWHPAAKHELFFFSPGISYWKIKANWSTFALEGIILSFPWWNPTKARTQKSEIRKMLLWIKAAYLETFSSKWTLDIICDILISF